MAERTYEIEQNGVTHVVRAADAVLYTGAPALTVHFWGRDAWLPVCTVLGRDNDSIDHAIARGVRASEDYRATFDT